MPDLFNAKKLKQPSTDENIKLEEKDFTHSHDTSFKGMKSRRVNPLNAFAFMPKNVTFVTRENEEKIVLLLRRHPITNVGWILVSLALLFAPLVLSQFPLLDFLPERFKLIAVLGWYMVTAGYILENFLNWFFNVVIITDERMIDIDFINLIYREISEAKLDNIQDVTTRMGSVLRTMFNFGDVLVQTASEVPNLEFSAVPKPDEIAKILRKLQVEEEQEALEGRVR